MKWVIKNYKELSRDELYNILKERVYVFVVEQKCPYPELDDKDLESYHIYLEEKGDVLAYLRVLKPGVSFGEVSVGRVLVREDSRGLGYGKELMKRAMKFIENDLKYKNIRLSAQEYLLKFYTELGFKRVSKMYLEDGIPHVEMLFQGNNN